MVMSLPITRAVDARGIGCARDRPLPVRGEAPPWLHGEGQVGGPEGARGMGAENRETVTVVVIGRDLGTRLEPGLRALGALPYPVVYVDSASSDESTRVASNLGATTLSLDPSKPLSAARGRNEGFHHAISIRPHTEFVQFVDGDCILDPKWIPTALELARSDPSLAVVCGRVREMHATRSTAAMLLDVDWDQPVGDTRACGGIFLARATAFSAVGGFSPNMVTGEEAELCARLLASGWRAVRVSHEMCQHDADIHSIRQWLGRAVRVGRTYTRSASLSGASSDPIHRRRIWSTLTWTVALPLVALGGLVGPASWHFPWVTLGVAILYAAQVLRVAWRKHAAGRPWWDALRYGGFSMLAKWAHLKGIATEAWGTRRTT